MALTAEEWHIVSIIVFPFLDIFGLTASIFISSANNRTVLAMGVIFSAGVLLSASLVHMLPHAAETLDIYFEEKSHADEEGHTDDHFSAFGHAAHDDDIYGDHSAPTDDHFESFGHAPHDDDIYGDHDAGETDDHAGHDHLRLMRFLQHDSHDDHEGEDPHAGHNHTFPWAQTIFSMAFILLLCIEATMERFIDMYFAGRKGNFFHHHGDEEEMMYAQGFAEDLEREKKEREDILDASQKVPAVKVQEANKLHDYGELESTKEEEPKDNSDDKVDKETETQLDGHHSHSHDHKQEAVVDVDGAHNHSHGHSHAHVDAVDNNDNNCSSGHTHAHNHGHSETETHNHDKKDDKTKEEAPKEEAVAVKDDDKATATDDSADTISVPPHIEEDLQPVAKPPPPGAELQMAYPDCEDCVFTREDLGYDDPDLHFKHVHKKQSLVKRRGTGSQGGSSTGLPGNMFQHKQQRRNSGASNVSGKSSVWAKSAARPSVVSFGVSPPMDEPELQQTINPWVSILLTVVLSIHVILEGLTIGSSQDVDTIKTTFVAIASHKVFAAFSLGSSLVASGYWESQRTMFFVLAGVFVGVDIISMGIGMALSSVVDQTTNVVGGFLQALLGGSFLFVATVELIPGELEKMRRYNLPLLPILLSLCTGFAVMTMLSKWGV